MRWAVDRLEGNIAIIENTITLEKKEVDVSLLPSSIYEGAILIYSDGQYSLDNDEEMARRKMIEEKFKRLRNNN